MVRKIFDINTVVMINLNLIPGANGSQDRDPGHASGTEKENGLVNGKEIETETGRETENERERGKETERETETGEDARRPLPLPTTGSTRNTPNINTDSIL